MKQLFIKVMFCLIVVTILTTSSVICAEFDFEKFCEEFIKEEPCSFYEDGNHVFEIFTSNPAVHPHNAYSSCKCEEVLWIESTYSSTCKICQKALCEKGIHYYLYTVYYDENSMYKGKGECCCGDRVEFDCLGTYLEEGTFTVKYEGLVIEGRHPHRAYDENTFEQRMEYEVTFPCCGLCFLNENYDEQVTSYNIEHILNPAINEKLAAIEAIEENEDFYYD